MEVGHAWGIGRAIGRAICRLHGMGRGAWVWRHKKGHA